MTDKFCEYLCGEGGVTRERALTARSYKNTNHDLEDKDTNFELATYGDAILKLALTKILFDGGAEKITEEKKKYESDEVLVRVIAAEYDLIERIRFDKNDKNIPQDYNYSHGSGGDSPHKYIATATEALLAAIYIDSGEDLDLIIEIVKGWMELIDSEAGD